MRTRLLPLFALDGLAWHWDALAAKESPHLNLAPFSPQMKLYFNPQQTPFDRWCGPQYGDKGPACFDYAFPHSDGTIMRNPMPDRLPKGWKLLPPGSALRYGDRVLYGLNNTTQHSAVVYSADQGVATWVQEILRTGGPVVFANPNDPMITQWMPPFAVVRPPVPDKTGALFPQDAIKPGVTPTEIYIESKWDDWKRSHASH